MAKKAKALTPVMLRVNEFDDRLIKALQEKMNIAAVSEVLRMGLKALADQQGVTL